MNKKSKIKTYKCLPGIFCPVFLVGGLILAGIVAGISAENCNKKGSTLCYLSNSCSGGSDCASPGRKTAVSGGSGKSRNCGICNQRGFPVCGSPAYKP